MTTRQTADRVFNYLTEHGKMSARDIADDFGLTDLDLQFADEHERCNRWMPVSPVPGGVGRWYGLRR